MAIDTIKLSNGTEVSVAQLSKHPTEAGATEEAGVHSVSLSMAAYRMLVDRTGSARPRGALNNCAWYWHLLCSEMRPYQDTRVAWIRDGKTNPIVGVLITQSGVQIDSTPDDVRQQEPETYEAQFGEKQREIRSTLFCLEDSLSERMSEAERGRLDNATEVRFAAIAPEYDQTRLFQDLVSLLPSKVDYLVHIPVSERQRWEACGFTAIGTEPQGARAGDHAEAGTIYEEYDVPDHLIMVSFAVDPAENKDSNMP